MTDINQIYQRAQADRISLQKQIDDLDAFLARLDNYAGRSASEAPSSAQKPSIHEGLQSIKMADSIKLVAQILREQGPVENGAALVKLFAERGYYVELRTLSSYMSQPSAKKLFRFNKDKMYWTLANESQQEPPKFTEQYKLLEDL